MALWQNTTTGKTEDDQNTAAPGEEGFKSRDLSKFNYLGRSPGAETPQAKDIREQQENDEAAAAAEQQRLADETRTVDMEFPTIDTPAEGT